MSQNPHLQMSQLALQHQNFKKTMVSTFLLHEDSYSVFRMSLKRRKNINSRITVMLMPIDFEVKERSLKAHVVFMSIPDGLSSKHPWTGPSAVDLFFSTSFVSKPDLFSSSEAHQKWRNSGG
ncbi:Uncharacterized protein Fot_32599 [Forsythia ovata]|uniref:Uncharacterized protein n=1 Tax=Forsythia ovata TaxID=205694 RepID=A0ABD1T8A8_9LAMI